MSKWANAVMVSYIIAFHAIAKFSKLLIVSIIAAAIPALSVVVVYNMIITVLN